MLSLSLQRLLRRGRTSIRVALALTLLGLAAVALTIVAQRGLVSGEVEEGRGSAFAILRVEVQAADLFTTWCCHHSGYDESEPSSKLYLELKRLDGSTYRLPADYAGACDLLPIPVSELRDYENTTWGLYFGVDNNRWLLMRGHIKRAAGALPSVYVLACKYSKVKVDTWTESGKKLAPPSWGGLGTCELTISPIEGNRSNLIWYEDNRARSVRRFTIGDNGELDVQLPEGNYALTDLKLEGQEWLEYASDAVEEKEQILLGDQLEVSRRRRAEQALLGGRSGPWPDEYYSFRDPPTEFNLKISDARFPVAPERRVYREFDARDGKPVTLSLGIDVFQVFEPMEGTERSIPRDSDLYISPPPSGLFGSYGLAVPREEHESAPDSLEDAMLIFDNYTSVDLVRVPDAINPTYMFWPTPIGRCSFILKDHSNDQDAPGLRLLVNRRVSSPREVLTVSPDRACSLWLVERPNWTQGTTTAVWNNLPVSLTRTEVSLGVADVDLRPVVDRHDDRHFPQALVHCYAFVPESKYPARRWRTDPKKKAKEGESDGATKQEDSEQRVETWTHVSFVVRVNIVDGRFSLALPEGIPLFARLAGVAIPFEPDKKDWPEEMQKAYEHDRDLDPSLGLNQSVIKATKIIEIKPHEKNTVTLE